MRTNIHILGSLFVLSHSPWSGEHELPYSDATSKDQLKQMTLNRARGGNLTADVSLRSPLQIVPVNYDTGSIPDDHEPSVTRGTRSCRLVVALCASLRPARRDSPRSSRYHAVCQRERRGRPQSVARITAIVTHRVCKSTHFRKPIRTETRRRTEEIDLIY